MAPKKSAKKKETSVQSKFTFTSKDEIPGIITCSSCSHDVPKTMFCLYCAAPILYKKPGEDILSSKG